jgi:glycerol uptake facilitator-like aquaporin
MAAFYDDTHHLVLSDTEARAGVTGHNVRYVLAFGMMGVIAAFSAIALYYGFDAIRASVTAALATHPSLLLRAVAPYATIALLGAIAAALMLGIWNAIAGRDDDDSQRFMRLRVVSQFAFICAIMAIFYLSAR